MLHSKIVKKFFLKDALPAFFSQFYVTEKKCNFAAFANASKHICVNFCSGVKSCCVFSPVQLKNSVNVFFQNVDLTDIPKCNFHCFCNALSGTAILAAILKMSSAFEKVLTKDEKQENFYKTIRNVASYEIHKRVA